ncbi:MAG: DNA cytosine methyltransferase, partial [Peptococcaceae bacterium]|nr:DNA cytosine methyltransferase [Peptococcaceae bacterium]
MPHRMVSLFTGAGGLDYGFEAAGFHACIGLGIDSDCCFTVTKNREWPVINKDIHHTSAREILDAGYLRQSEVDPLVGGPP